MLGKVRNLKKTYRRKVRKKGFLNQLKSFFFQEWEKVEALKGISFDIKKGEILGYIGPNGAGKTTTIKILSGIMYPDEGEVNIMGFTPWLDREKYLYNVGVLFSGISPTWYYLPLYDTLDLLKEIYGLSNEEFKDRIELFDELLNIKELLKTPPRKMSMGQRKKADLLCAFIHKPRIVFLDEPTVYLDIISKENIHNFLKEIVKREKTSIFLTTHLMDDVEKLSNRIIVINQGKKVFEGKLEDLKKRIGYKYIEIKGNYKLKDYDIEVIYASKNYLKAKVPIKEIKNILTEIAGQDIDINIYPPDLEEIIKVFYENDNSQINEA